MQVYFVGVKCSLKKCEAREILRGKRAIGETNSDDFEAMHRPTHCYDLVVDTTYDSPFDAARTILTYIENNPEPQGFARSQKKLDP